MPYNHPIPDAPVAPSMLPRVPAADLTSQDVLVLTQPGNNPGQKNKGLELGTLFSSNLLKWSSVIGGRVSNIIHYQGAIPTYGNTPKSLVKVEVDPREQVIFLVDGTSNPPTYSEGGSKWYHILRSKVDSEFPPEDITHTRNETIYGGFVEVEEGNICSSGNMTPYYHGEFHEVPHTYPLPAGYDPDSPTRPKKEVILKLWCTDTASPYTPVPPSSFDLYIQAIIFKASYDSTILTDVSGS